MAIVLIGFMGSGKTSVGKILAEKLELSWVDLDKKFTEEFGWQISDFFEKFGEEAFREKESQLLERELTKDVVLSTGGGVVVREVNRKLLRQFAKCVYLSTPFSVMVERIQEDTRTLRPLANGNSLRKLEDLYQQRKGWYKEVANLIVETDGKTPEEVANEIIQKM